MQTPSSRFQDFKKNCLALPCLALPCLALVLSCALLLATPQLSHAQSLEEVIVTAERRAESLQQTPISVTAFTGDAISQGGITGIEDVALQTPNFKLTTFNITEPQLYIRGIGSTNDSIGADPAVAVFIDDVYIGRPSGASTDLYDLERIEVLRGPQGTLYGRNSAGGTLNIFTRKPQQEFEAKTGLTVGSEELINFRGYINGPISDTVAGKLTVNIRQRAGYAENVTTGEELEDDDTKSLRGQLLFTPADSVNVLLGFDYTDIDTSGSNRHLTNFDIAPPPLAEPERIAAGRAANAVFGDDPRKSSHNDTQVSEKELLGLLARVDIDMNWATLTSISSYRESESSWFQPLVPVLSIPDGGLGLFEVNDGAVQEADQVSQEFRLAAETDGLKWVAGLYYFKENADKSERFETYWHADSGLGAFNPGDVSFIQDGSNESTAVFGQLTWDFTDALALTAGARYTEDKKEIDNSVTSVSATVAGLHGIPLGPFGSPYSVAADESWSDTTYRATLDWDISDDHMIYITYSEGFKSGAFIGSQSRAAIAETPINPETSINYELGARTQWLDDRIRFNISYFDIDYEDLQTYMLEGVVLTASNASAEVSGVEADFAIAITENFSISGSYSTLDGEFVEGANDGNDLPRAPESSWSLAPRLSIPFAGGAALDFGVTASYTDEYHFEIGNDLRGLEEDVTVVDASAKYTSADENWDVTLWGKNLGDELYSVHHINGTLGGATRIYAPPRTYGLSYNYHWR